MEWEDTTDVKRNNKRRDRALKPAIRKRKSPVARKAPLGLDCAYDSASGQYSPRRLFAFWGKTHVLGMWVRSKELNGFHDPFLMRLLNLPTFILASYKKWYLANSDNEFLITVPWDDLDSWLKKNGFTGKVADGGDWSP